MATPAAPSARRPLAARLPPRPTPPAHVPRHAGEIRGSKNRKAGRVHASGRCGATYDRLLNGAQCRLRRRVPLGAVRLRPRWLAGYISTVECGMRGRGPRTVSSDVRGVPSAMRSVRPPRLCVSASLRLRVFEARGAWGEFGRGGRADAPVLRGSSVWLGCAPRRPEPGSNPGACARRTL